ncbi:MAG: hypothetical protein JSW33_08560 [bacterium]|nr:MAG: hypothetical protein JSW33_08560 [bacterium]
MQKNVLARSLWVVILVLFLSLQAYNYLKGNYFDLLTTALIILIAFLMLGVIVLIRRDKTS